jgi:hypothetical protein
MFTNPSTVQMELVPHEIAFYFVIYGYQQQQFVKSNFLSNLYSLTYYFTLK